MHTAFPIQDVDWPSFIGRHDMRFDRLPQGWTQAPHFGNAMIGSMLYQVGESLRLQVFRADVHDHRDDSHGWTAYSRPRFMIGHFELQTCGRLTGCNWRKDLWQAELTGSIDTERGTIQIRHFTHAIDMAIVTELTPSPGEAACTWTWHPHPAKTTRPDYPTDSASLQAYGERYGRQHVDKLQPWTPNPDGRLEARGDIRVWVQDLLAGGQYATAWADAHHATRRTLIVSIANAYPQRDAADTAVAEVERCRAIERDRWMAEHRRWWQDYYRRSYVSIPDRRLESLYWQSVYRYGCSARAGRFYVDTSGLWFQGGPWAYTTHDWNTQSAHWGVYAANRLEQGEEIVNRLYAGRANLIAAVEPHAWQEDSAYLALATADDMAGSRSGDMRYHDLLGCLPWALHNAWWQYRFSMDDAMLREKIYPLLRRAINLYLHIAEEGDDGRIHLPPTYSPETGVWRNANFDLALFKWGCHVLLRSCARLRIDDPLMPRWRDVIERLVEFPADEHGFMLGSDETARLGHRHLSQLLMIYPLYLVNIEQHGAAEVLHRSYEAVRGETGPDARDPCKLVAMLQTHAAPIGCALGRSDDALAGVQALADDLSSAGLWPPQNMAPCIESTLGLLNIVQDMLIQSWSDPAAEEPGPIRIFPALPQAWGDVTFLNLRAEGAFLVSAQRVGGATRWVKVESLAGEPCRVRPGMTRRPAVRAERDPTLIETQPGVYRLDLRQGESVELVG